MVNFFSIHAKPTNFDAQVKARVFLITLCAMVLITATTDLIRVLKFYKNIFKVNLIFCSYKFQPNF